MSVEWQIKRANDSVKTFTEAAIINVTRQLYNQGVDTADVTFGFASIFTPQQWDENERIRILRDGEIWFSGRNLSARPAATGSSESYVMTIAGPWWELDRLIYMQPADFVSDPDANPTPAAATLALTDFETETVLSSTIFLSQDEAGIKVDTAAMIADVLEYAIASGVHLQIGTIDAGVQAPREEIRAATCAGIIKRLLRWTPGQTAWMDYSTTPPTIHIRKRANRELYVFDLGDEETESVDLTARRDLVLSGVRIEYLREHERQAYKFRTLDVDEAGPSPTGIRALVVPIELYGSYLANGQLIAAEPIPEGVAAAIYEAYDSVPYEGRLKLARQDVSGDVWLSKTARITGGNPEWESMRADIQSVTDTTADGRTELTLGPPRHLGPVDMLALIRGASNRLPPLPDSYLRAGGSPSTNEIPPDSVDPRMLFGSNPPKYILTYHSWQVDFGCIGSGAQDNWAFEAMMYHDTFGGPAVDNLRVDALLVGQVLAWHNASVGRASDKAYGMRSSGTCPFTYPAPPYTSFRLTVKITHLYGDGHAPTVDTLP